MWGEWRADARGRGQDALSDLKECKNLHFIHSFHPFCRATHGYRICKYWWTWFVWISAPLFGGYGSLTRCHLFPFSCLMASRLYFHLFFWTCVAALSHPLLLCLENDSYKENHLGKFQAAVTKPISTEGRLITQLINPTDVTLNACFFVILLHTSCWLNRLHGPCSKCLHRLLETAASEPGACC